MWHGAAHAVGAGKRPTAANSQPVDAPWSLRILAAILCGVLLARMIFAKKGRQYFIRRIPGIDAIEEAMGRATEMGRPIIYTTGINSFDNMQTLAGLAVLSWVARQCARMMVRIIVPVCQPVVVSATADILRESFRAEGREEMFDPADVPFLSTDQNAYAAGTIGSMVRNEVAAAFYIGGFGFESLLLAETGNRIGAIQIAATADYFQIPFFICACDYTLIGEELYAAGAYLTREPVQVGSLVGQDLGKLMILLILAVGSAFAVWSQGNLNPIEGLLGK